MSIKNKSIGIRTDTINIDSSEIEETVDHKTSSMANDGDESSVISFVNEKQPKPKKYDSDTSSINDYYKMKPIGMNNQFKRPCKIEFQMVNSPMKQRMRRLSKNHGCSSCQCHNCNNQQYVQHMHNQNHNTNHMVAHGANEQANAIPENYECSPKNDGRFRKVFPCLQPGSESDEYMDNDKEQNENEENAKQDNIKTEYYNFDHGAFDYFRTTDRAPHLASDAANERIQRRATKFWAEFFGTINVAVTFVLVFFQQFYKFILYSIVRSTLVSTLQTSSDYCLKPILAVIFNGVIQPILLFLKNIFESIWNTLEPVAQMFLGFCLPFIECLRSFRIVDVYHGTQDSRRKHQEDSIV